MNENINVEVARVDAIEWIEEIAHTGLDRTPYDVLDWLRTFTFYALVDDIVPDDQRARVLGLFERAGFKLAESCNTINNDIRPAGDQARTIIELCLLYIKIHPKIDVSSRKVHQFDAQLLIMKWMANHFLPLRYPAPLEQPPAA